MKRVTVKYRVDPEDLVKVGITENPAEWEEIEVELELEFGEAVAVLTLNGESVRHPEDLGE